MQLFWLMAAAVCAAAAPAERSAGDPYAANVAQTSPRTPEEERRGFHLPPGFEVQLVAAEPYVRKPINMQFDDRGRIWVTESVQYPFPAGPWMPHRDSVRILEDRNGEGSADEVTTFTSGLNIPIGLLPVSGGAIIYSIPTIDRFYDRDGDDRAKVRKRLYGTFGFEDTHGMTGSFTRGFDGWIYACHGFANSSEVHGADGSIVRMQSGNTYRFREDGSRVEPWTRGQVNPFGLAFDPLGNLYSCDSHSRPIYMLLRGAYYPCFSKPDDGLGFGPEMMTHDHGSTAIAGITYYASSHFPKEYRDTIFIGNVVTNRINRDRLERHGSSYRAIIQPDFLASDDPWFRPVDIKLGPDGALYVADFYNRIIGHYEVPLTHPGRDHDHGRIWRIVYKGEGGDRNPRPPRRDWTKATVSELIEDLAYPNLTVRMKATQQLVERGGGEAASAVHSIMSAASSPWQRMHGLWVLERLDSLDDATLLKAAADADAGVRVHVMRVLTERPRISGSVRELLLNSLRDVDAFVQRGAAEALGTHPYAANIRPLLDLRHRVPEDDTHLLHMVRMALRDQMQTPASWQSLPLATFTERDDAAMADVAPGVHTASAARFLVGYLQRRDISAGDEWRYVLHIARHGDPDTIHALLQYTRGGRPDDLLHQAALLRALSQGMEERGQRLESAARAWAETLAGRLLESPSDAELAAGIELSASSQMTRSWAKLSTLVMDRHASQARRAEAMLALVAIDPGAAIGRLGRVLADADESDGIRSSAAQSLSQINRPEAEDELLQNLGRVSQQLAIIVATSAARNQRGAIKLLDAIEQGKASPRLLQDPRVDLYLAGPNKVPGVIERLAKLTAGLPPADSRLDGVIHERRHGFLAARSSPTRGVKVFEKNCAICHTLNNHGTRIGPQLDGIGSRGVDRLLEDVLDPNRNVDPAFRVTTLTLKSGQVETGLVLRQEGEVLVLANSQGKELRVPVKQIDERAVSPMSPMPANFAAQIDPQDLYDLLAYLLTSQPSTEAKGQAVSGSH